MEENKKRHKKVDEKSVKKQEVKPINPNSRFGKDIDDMKKYLQEKGFELSQKEGSKRIFAKKIFDTENITTKIMLIPIAVNNWKLNCITEKNNKETSNIFCNEYSTKSAKELINLYA